MPCLALGVVVATEHGEIPLDRLRPGIRVITRDNGLQPLRWIVRRQLSWADLVAAEHLKPVRVAAASLDGHLPERAFHLSPNHRILAPADRTLLQFRAHEALVSAKHLVGRKRADGPLSAEVLYLHPIFDRHELILLNGAWSEAFHPSDRSLNGLGNAQRQELLELFPDLKPLLKTEASPAARYNLNFH